MMGSPDGLYRAIHTNHVFSQTHNASTSSAYCQPTFSFVIDDYTRIESGFAFSCYAGSVCVYQTMIQRAWPRSYRGCGCQHCGSTPAIGEIEVEVSLAVRFLTFCDRRCPWCLYPWGDAVCFNNSVIGPVCHVIGRHHHQRFDVFVGVFSVTAYWIILLLIVCCVHINSAIIFYCSWIRCKHKIQQGISISCGEFRGNVRHGYIRHGILLQGRIFSGPRILLVRYHTCSNGHW